MPTVTTIDVNGMRLRHHRKQVGWSQGELSRRSGVSRSFITELERGSKKPSRRVATVLALTLGVDVDDLISS